MEENIQPAIELKEYKYKVDKIERYLSFAALILFFLSFNNKLAGFAFFVFTIAIFVYYFIWYRKRPPYIKIDLNEITVHEGFLFKPVVMGKSEIKTIDKYEKRIELNLKDGKKVTVLGSLLSDADFKEVHEILKESKI